MLAYQNQVTKATYLTMSEIHYILLHYILLSSICLPFRLSTANLLGNETDRLALLAFKSQIYQDPAKIMSSWNDSNHFCEWKGVGCSRRHQRVTVLDIDSKGLMGTISPHIGNLSFLKILVLQRNRLYGIIPQELGRLSRLEDLVLHNNSFAGQIPVNISYCSNLKKLYLSRNSLIGNIPLEFGSLSKISDLILQYNNLTGGIPDFLGNLTTLERISLTGNRFNGEIPSSFDKLKQLKDLKLAVNNLSGQVPPSLYNISYLEIFSVAANNLTGNFPTEIGLSLPNIVELVVGQNQFNGPIPDFLFNASKLRIIEFGVNQFTGKVPLSVGNQKELVYLSLVDNNLGSGGSEDLDFFTPLANCTKLNSLGLGSNQFGGMLPVSIGNFSKELSMLDVGQNQLFGNIPTELQNLQNLIALVLSGNFFNGSLPMSLGNMQKLQMLGLSSNQLSGFIPSFRNLTQLYRLELSNNNFKGNISSILQTPNLQIMYLSFNSFTGPIPKEIGLNQQLLQISLNNNSLSGTLPVEIGNLGNLGYLDISENNISGELPSSLGSSLQYISLHSNSFQGPLPSSLNTLIDLRFLDVSYNNFSGYIPKALEKISDLTSLNLSFNNFMGEVPVEGIFKTASAVLLSGNHGICGGIPEFRLPKCNIPRSKKKGDRLALKITLGLFIPFFIVGVVLLIYLRKKTRAKSPSKHDLENVKRVSYSDIYKATDKFSSTNLIGKGSYGTVYKGVFSQGEGQVAIKVLNLMEQGAFKTFVAECEVLRVIRHRNLLKILTVCSAMDFNGNDFKALVFDLMPNGSLDSWLHPSSDEEHELRSLNLHKRLDLATDVASVLDYLHNDCERPIIHCDLKPSNILLDEDMIAHVGDFGLSKFFPATTSSINSTKNDTTSFSIRGTIGYIPPEYGMGADVSMEGDVYSYGILLLEMFTGKRPTDEMFKDGRSLRDFTKRALPEQVMEIIDTSMLLEETYEDALKSMNQIKICLSSIIKIGLACSVDLMTERMNIKDVLKELHSIRKYLLQV